MKCPECNEKLVDYLYNDLPPEEKRTMDEHFKNCEHCAKQLSQFQSVRTTFQQLKTHEPHPLVHQRILAHAKDMDFQKRRSWLIQLLLRPSTATVMAALLVIGVFYYTQQFTSLKNNEKVIIKAERRVKSGKERSQITRAKPMISEPSPEEEIATRLITQARPPAAKSGDMNLEQLKALNQMARTFIENQEKDQALSIQSKDVLYAFELGNLYFSQSDFEKAIATYSIALMMNPREEYTSIIRYQLASSYKKLNDCKSAVKVLDEIQRRHPHYQEIDKVIIMAGDCYLDLQVYDKAETNYNNFIHQFPDRKSLVADKLETARKFRRVNLSY